MARSLKKILLGIFIFAFIFSFVNFLIVTPKIIATAEDYNIESVRVNIGSDISVKFYVPIIDDVKDLKLNVNFLDNDTLLEDYVEDNGYAVFQFTGVSPNHLSDDMVATLYYDGEAQDTVTKSVASYLKQLLNNTKEQNGESEDSQQKLITLIRDMLRYGAESQLYCGETDASKLVTYGVTTGSESEYVSPENVDNAFVGDDAVKSAMDFNLNIRFDNNIIPLVIFKLPNSVTRDNLSIKINDIDYLDGKIISLTGNYAGYYQIAYEDMSLSNIDTPFNVKFYDNGTLFATLTTSARSYIKGVESSVTIGALAQATYKYAKSATAYAIAHKQKDEEGFLGTYRKSNGDVLVTKDARAGGEDATIKATAQGTEKKVYIGQRTTTRAIFQFDVTDVGVETDTLAFTFYTLEALDTNNLSKLQLGYVETTADWDESTIVWADVKKNGNLKWTYETNISCEKVTGTDGYSFTITTKASNIINNDTIYIDGDGHKYVTILLSYSSSAGSDFYVYSHESKYGAYMTINKPAESLSNYYFDSNAEDGGNGTIDLPYNNLSYTSSISNLKGGDGIYLKCGSTFTGSLSINGLCGEEGNPIVVTSYGEGDLPKIDGNGLTGTGVVYVKNCSYIIIENLEIYDTVNTEGDRRGVYVYTDNPNGTSDIITYHDITVQNLIVHDIRGILDADNNGMSSESKATGGIRLKTTSNGTVDGFYVKNNKVYTCDNCGISTQYGGGTNPYKNDFLDYAMKNVEISYNEIYDIGKNAIFLRGTYGGLISHNIVHDTATRCYAGNTIVTCRVYKVTIEYNEGYRNMAQKNPNGKKNLQDGCMLDADLQSRETIWQYNYSHDNSFGLFLNCTGASSDDTDSQDEAIVRYNISVADKGGRGVIVINYYAKSLEIYNNTIIATDQTNCIFYDNDNRTYHLFNNIFYDATESGGTASSVRLMNLSKATLNNNLMYSKAVTITDIDKFLANSSSSLNVSPQFVNEDFGDSYEDRIGYETGLEFAQLLSWSPCLVSDNAVSVEGVDKDIAGNPYQPSIGCYSA